MSLTMQIIVLLFLACLSILLVIIMGDYGPWYLAWLLGTGFMILVAAMGGVLFEDQEEEQRKKAQSKQS